MGVLYIPGFGQSANQLQDEDTTTDTTSSDFATFGATNAYIIIDGEEIGINASGLGFLGGHAKVQNIASVVFTDNQNTPAGINTLKDCSSNLLGAGTGEDGARNTGSQHALADITSECGFVTGTTTGNDADLRGLVFGWTAIDDSVLTIKRKPWVCVCERFKRIKDELVGLVEEMFCCCSKSNPLAISVNWHVEKSGATLDRRETESMVDYHHLLCIMIWCI